MIIKVNIHFSNAGQRVSWSWMTYY